MKKSLKFIIPVVIILFIVSIVLYMRSDKIVEVDDGEPTISQEELEKQLEKERMTAFLLRGAPWGESSEVIMEKEEGTILDVGKNYITVDYESVFGEEHLPTYLFDKDKLVAIVYERVFEGADDENKTKLSLIHQKIASRIHYVYEELYEEDFRWIDTMSKKYDTNLWNESILSGELTMKSIWNGTNEKIFLHTVNSPMYEFLLKDAEDFSLGYQGFTIVSEDYLKNNKEEDLIKIKPE